MEETVNLADLESAETFGGEVGVHVFIFSYNDDDNGGHLLKFTLAR